MSVRIISGERRGAIIDTPPGEETRPLRDRIRQALFNMLRPRMRNSVCVDCFGGSGAVGLEALSNGASQVTFVEKWPIAAAVIHDNIRKLRYEAKANLIKGESPACFAKLPNNHPPIDLLFLMPPYHSDLCPAVMADAEVLRRLAPDALAVCEIHREEPFVPPDRWQVEDDRQYGITRLVLLALRNTPGE